jgi:anti-anti-sigma factor
MNPSLRMGLHPSQLGPKLTAAGRLDVCNADSLLRVFVCALRIRGITVVLLDLAEVTFIDTAGTSALLDCRRLARQAGIRMQITGVSAPVLAAARARDAVVALGLVTLTAAIGCITARRPTTWRRVDGLVRRGHRRFCRRPPAFGAERR